MDKKIGVIALLAIVGISAFALFNVPVNVAVNGKNPLSEAYSEEGLVCIQKIDGLTGQATDYGCSHNLLTNYGSVMYDQMANGTASYWNFTNMTLGGNTSALAATDTDLANMWTSTEGLGPASATVTNVASGNTSLNYQWTSTGAATYHVNSTGIYNITGAATHLISEAYFGSDVALNGANGDKLNVTYYRKVS